MSILANGGYDKFYSLNVFLNLEKALFSILEPWGAYVSFSRDERNKEKTRTLAK